MVPERQWLIELYEEHGAKLHRLCVLLGAETDSGHIIRSAFLALGRRGRRLVDPLGRVEFVQEQVVHQARSARGGRALHFPEVLDTREREILHAMGSMPVKASEILVVSHYLSIYGPELAGIMRLTVRGSNHRLEQALDALRHAVGDPTPTSQPGVIESLSQEVTAALRSSARQVSPPGTETLRDELLVESEPGGHQVAWYVAAPVLALSLLAGLALASSGTSQGTEPSIPPTQAPSTVPVPTASRSLPARVRSVPVYYTGRDNGRLYREYRDLASTGDLVAAALEAILVVAPLDPDYRSQWSSGRVLATQLEDGVLVIDLSEEAFEGIDSASAAEAAAMQMVYTASDLLGDSSLSIQLLSEGGAPPEPFDSLAEGVTRRGLEPMPGLWITSPRNNQQLSQGQVRVTGTVKPGVSAPVVSVANESGTVIETATPQPAVEPNESGWRVWSLTLVLDPGTYTIHAVSTSGPETGPEPEAGASVETKTIVVS